MPLQDKKVWVRLQACAFKPRPEEPERFVPSHALKEPGVLITTFVPGTLGAEYYAKTSTLHRQSFEDRTHAGRVHYINGAAMADLESLSKYGMTSPTYSKALNEWRADLMKHIESELGRD